MKCSGVPFTHISEWKRCSPSSGLSSSLGSSLVVATMALGSVSMICLPISGFDSESKPASNLEAFTSATSDCFEQKSVVLCQGILWKSHHFPVSFFVFPVSSFSCWVCVIFFARVVVSERLRRARRGGVQRGGAPRAGVRGQRPRNFFFRADIFSPGRHIFAGTTYFRDHMILGGFSAHGFLPMVFYFQLRN
jgi:hypothetical protein